jgi:hypothetical protein
MPPVDTMGTISRAMLFMRENMASSDTEGAMLMGGTCTHDRSQNHTMYEATRKCSRAMTWPSMRQLPGQWARRGL